MRGTCRLDKELNGTRIRDSGGRAGHTGPRAQKQRARHVRTHAQFRVYLLPDPLFPSYLSEISAGLSEEGRGGVCRGPRSGEFPHLMFKVRSAATLLVDVLGYGHLVHITVLTHSQNAL